MIGHHPSNAPLHAHVYYPATGGRFKQKKIGEGVAPGAYDVPDPNPSFICFLHSPLAPPSLSYTHTLSFPPSPLSILLFLHLGMFMCSSAGQSE